MEIEPKSNLVKLRNHLDKFLGLYVGLMIVIGSITGYYSMHWVMHHQNFLQILMKAAIYIMIFPMMLMLNTKALGKSFTNWKVTTAVILMNFIYGPAMAVLLGSAFVNNPFIRLGLFIGWLVPCSSMSIGYVGLMRGDINSATAMVALSFILSLALIPLETSGYISLIFVHQIHGSIMLTSAAMSKIEMSTLMAIIEILLIPLIIAIPSHEAIIRKTGIDGFRKISPLFSTLTMLGLFLIIFVIFFAHAGMLVTHIKDVLGVFYSAMVFAAVSLTLFTFLFKYVKLDKTGTKNYRSSMVAILTGIPKNEATAIALSSTALASLGSQYAFLASLAPSLLPAFQVVFIIVFLKLRDKLIRFYGGNAKELEIIEEEEIRSQRQEKIKVPT
jgi:ACR3 family arsenite efflux pump ArsB